MGLGPILGRGEDLPRVRQEYDPLPGTEGPHVDLVPVFLRHGPQVVVLVRLGVQVARRSALRYFSTSALLTSSPVTRNPIMNVASTIVRNPKASAM